MKENEISEQRAAFLAEDFGRGFIEFCGITAEAVRPGYFESKVDIDKQHRQQDGFVHAGLMATMADHTAGYSAFTLAPEDHQILTIEFKINFLKPAHGKSLVCRSTVIRGGKQIIISESNVFDVRNSGEVQVAKALVTLMSVPRAKITKT
jgi:uncharacterized protein (TIGR00369 family)